MKQQHTLQPKLRFPEFEGDWKLITIKEATNNHNNKRKPLKDSDRTVLDKIYPYYGASGIIDYVDEYLFDGEYLLLGEDGANIISRNSRLVFIAKGKFWVNNHAHVFSAKTNYDLRFLSDRLEYINYVIYNTGTAQPKLNSAVVANIEFKVPSLPEQKKIADYLSTIDTKINLLEEKKAQLALYKKAMMQKLFAQEIRFKQDDGNDFPEWEEKRLGDFLVKYDQKTTINDQYPVLTSSRKGIFFQKEYYNGQDVASSDTTGYNIVPNGYFTYRHMSDDLIFKFNINTICENGIVSTLYPVFTTKNINNNFLQIKLNEGKEFKRYAILQKQGGSRTYMYFSKLIELRLSLPSLSEQQKIADFLLAIDESIEKVNEQISQTQSFKKAMLQQLFV